MRQRCIAVFAAIAFLLSLDLVNAVYECAEVNVGQWVGASRQFGPMRGGGHAHECACVKLVRTACNAPVADKWRQGPRIRDLAPGEIPPNTAIATFANGKFTGHSAIFLSKTSEGINVIDQGRSKPTHERFIKFNNGGDHYSNDADKYHIIL